MSRKLLAILIFVLIFPLCAEEESEIFGNYDNGRGTVSMEDIRLYREIMSPERTSLRQHLYLIDGGCEDTHCFERIVAEAVMSRMLRESLDEQSAAEHAKELESVRKVFLDELISNEILEMAHKVSDKDLRDYYDGHKENYLTKDGILIRMIFKEFGLHPDAAKKDAVRQAAEAILTEARKDPSRFGDLARLHSDSTTASDEGRIGLLQRDTPTLNPRFFDAVWNMEQGDISDVMELPSGYAIIFLEEKRPARIPGFDEILNLVKGDAIKMMLDRLQKQYADEPARAKLRETILLDPSCHRQFHLLENAFYAKRHMDRRIDESMREIDESEIRRFYRQKRGLLMTQPSWEVAVITIAPGASKARIVEHYAAKAAETKALEIIEKIKDGMKFSEAATEYSDDPSSSSLGYFGRVSRETHFPLADVLKTLAPGQVGGPLIHDGKYWIVKVLGIRERKQVSFEESREVVERRFRQAAIENRKLALFREYAMRAVPRVINTKKPPAPVEGDLTPVPAPEPVR